LALALGPALVAFGLTLSAVRWWGFADALLLPLLALEGAWLAAPSARRGRLAWGIACGAIFLPGAYQGVVGIGQNLQTSLDDVHEVAERDLAHWLRQRAGGIPTTVAASPDLSTFLIYHGGVSGLGTLYWENREGLKHAAAIFSAPDFDHAHALIRRYGVRYLVFTTWDDFTQAYAHLSLGLPPSAPALHTWVVDLFTRPVPPAWLRSVPYRLPPHPDLAGQRIAVYEVTEDQAPERCLAQQADFLLEMGYPQVAERFLPALDAYPRFLPGLAARAAIDVRLDRRDDFVSVAERIMNEPAPSGLRAEDHIHLARVLAIAGENARASAEMAAADALLDERGLRELSAADISDLITLGSELGSPIPDPSLRGLAAELRPPR
jgi:hypothetical protein